MTNERRRTERQTWLRLESRVNIKRSLFKREWIPVVPFDFSRYGMGIQTDEVYMLGDEVVLSLTLHKGELEIDIPLLKGLVRYKEKHHSRFNYGVEFCFPSKSEKLALDEELVGIERLLRRHELEAMAENGETGDDICMTDPQGNRV